MKNLSLLFLLITSFAFSQMPDISTIWLNKSQYYKGSISDKKTELRIKFTTSSQDQKNDQEYFVSGQSVVEGNISNLEGKIKITQYKGGKKRSKVYGEYEILEEPNGKHTGIFKGKFIYTFRWNKKTQSVEDHYVQFTGNWTSYDNTLQFKTDWDNHD